MPLSLVHPTATEVGQALINVIKTEYDSGASSVLKTALSAYGVTLDTTADPNDPGEYGGVKFGGRFTLPDGYTVFVIPINKRLEWESAPYGRTADYLFEIFTIYTQTDDQNLMKTQGKYQRMLTDAAEALAVVLGPAGVNADAGHWTVAGVPLREPWVKSGEFVGMARYELEQSRHQKYLYSKLYFGAVNPFPDEP